ncbi:endolytic transglycosylase MltG [Planococcus lenghuensis]|uniref:Endolytic murein transglycosylase n=1 Tax=Planococcus lenghuensis TaxID=2213202 RepID=A0A1Q2KXT8_9BACL|nr:endolytic transglycosylase MltG [Planococcus lenghuensis]AQQ52936.1 hypothetical protein B0X71_07425 [Planococcus lenghuensis]
MENQSKKDVMFERMKEKKREAKIIRRIVFAVFLILLIIAGTAGYKGYQYVYGALQPVDPEAADTITVEVPIGSSVDSIAALLEENGLVEDERIYRYYVKFNNEAEFQAGTYELSPSMTLAEITESLKTGTVYHEPVFTMTVPEGLQLEQIAAIVAEHTDYTAEEFMELATDEEFIDELIAQYPGLLSEEIKGEGIRYALEGYLFPITYSFYEEAPPLETIINDMVAQTALVLQDYTPALQELEKSPHWLLTFASLLEEEATSQSDRQTIASVFYNRLDNSMRLQTDPTVIYGMDEHQGRLTNADYQFDSPYNTYLIDGLPPGPIAAPGRASIEAVLDPANTDYLFFLADENGRNYFAETYEEHLENQAEHIGN